MYCRYQSKKVDLQILSVSISESVVRTLNISSASIDLEYIKSWSLASCPCKGHKENTWDNKKDAQKDTLLRYKYTWGEKLSIY